MTKIILLLFYENLYVDLALHSFFSALSKLVSESLSYSGK